ncbi:MAG: hypothetical protein HY320_01895 [Armatimonadetes bacterium]|nr:hypothetical protein [Armatimonadota bacterium]
MQRLLIRVATHSLLAGIWLAASWATLVWPQSFTIDGLDRSLAVQAERATALSDRLDLQRVLNRHLATWKTERRRVLMEEELPGYFQEARATVRAVGARLLSLRASADTDGRWEAYGRLNSEAPDGDDPATVSYTVGAQRVRVWLAGPFPAVYRAAAYFTGSKPLSVLNHWEMCGAGEGVRAFLVTTVFTIRRATPTAAPSSAPRGEGVAGWDTGPRILG